jgi:hypothetical protein
VTDEIPVYLERESTSERKMMVRFRYGNDERENRYWAEGEEEKMQDVPREERDERAYVERMRRNEREEGKGAKRNTEQRRKGDRMDERNMEEEGKDRKRKGWRIGKNVNFWNCIFMFVIRNRKARRADKALLI